MLFLGLFVPTSTFVTFVWLLSDLACFFNGLSPRKYSMARNLQTDGFQIPTPVDRLGSAEDPAGSLRLCGHFVLLLASPT